MPKIEDWELEAALEVAEYRVHVAAFAERRRNQVGWHTYDQILSFYRASTWELLWRSVARARRRQVKKHAVFEELEEGE